MTKRCIMSAIVTECLCTRIGVAHNDMNTMIHCYRKRVTVYVAAIAVGDSINYQSFVYGSFKWTIHVKYNNMKGQVPSLLF